MFRSIRIEGSFWMNSQDWVYPLRGRREKAVVLGVIEGGSSRSSISATGSDSWSSGSGVGPEVDAEFWLLEEEDADGLRTSIVDTVDDFEADLVAFFFFSDSSCSQGEGKALLMCYVNTSPSHPNQPNMLRSLSTKV